MIPFFDIYGCLLKEKQREILENYYNGDLSFSEISQNEGITRQGISDNIKRSEMALLKFEDKLKLVSLLNSLQGCIEDIDENSLQNEISLNSIYLKKILEMKNILDRYITDII